MISIYLGAELKYFSKHQNDPWEISPEAAWSVLGLTECSRSVSQAGRGGDFNVSTEQHWVALSSAELGREILSLSRLSLWAGTAVSAGLEGDQHNM